MPYKTKTWSAAMRQKQAIRCKRQKPWTSATGPKTTTGKKAVKYNALKHGNRSKPAINLRKAFYAQRQYIRALAKELGCKLY